MTFLFRSVVTISYTMGGQQDEIRKPQIRRQLSQGSCMNTFFSHLMTSFYGHPLHEVSVS